MNADKIVKFDRNKSEAIFTESLNDLDNLNTRDGRFEYADYVALHNDVTALYDSFSYVDEIIESLQAQLAASQRRERAAVEAVCEFVGEMVDIAARGLPTNAARWPGKEAPNE